MNDKLQKLYNTLRNDYGENFNVDYDTFVNDMRDKEKRTRLYNTMRNDYGEHFNRSFDEFSSDMGVDAPVYLQRSTGHYPSPEPSEPGVAISEQEEHHDEADAASALPVLATPAISKVQNPFDTMNTGVALNDGKKSFDDVATENYSRYRTENLFKSHLKRQLEETKERVAADYEKEYDKEAGEKFKKEKEVGFFKSALRNLASARMIPVPHEDMPKSGNYSVATHFIEDANRVLRESEKKGDSAWKKIGRGVSHALLDTDTWSMGVLEFDRNNRVAHAVKKYEEGKTLSESETQMLDALALNLAVHQYYGSDISRQYKWGQIAGQSAPFMVEMLLNPISGAGKGLAKQLAKYGIKRFAATGGKKLAIKAGARALGDVGAAFGMVATSGMPRTAADAVQRMTGEGTFDIDEDGNVKYTGHEKGLDAPQAIYKAIVGQAIEYQSEMLGSSGVGTLLKKIPGLNILSKKIKATGFGRFMGKMNNSPTYRTLKGIEQRAQWSGTFEEYGEEFYGTLMNALLVGDNKLSDLVDLDEQVDTFMGLALTGGAMSALNTGGYTIDRARVGRRLRVADKAAGELFGNWARQKALLGDMNVGERTASVAATLRRNDITNEAKKAYMDYATSLTFKESMTGAAAETMKLSDKSTKTKKRIADEVIHPIVDEEADMFDINVHAEAMYTTKKAQEVLDEVFENSEYDGIDFAEIPNLPEAEQHAAVERILNEEGLSDEQKHAVLDYVRARNTEFILQSKLDDVIDNSKYDNIAHINERVNKKTGTLVAARIKGTEDTIYITDGLALKEDAEAGGFVPDGEHSDDTVYYLDTDGNVKPTTANDVEIVGNEDAQTNIDEVQKIYASLHATQQQEIEKRFDEMIAEESRVTTPSPPATADERTSQPVEEEPAVPENEHVENNPADTEADMMADNPYANATEEELQEALSHLKTAIESGILSPEQEVANFDEQEKIAKELAARQQSLNEIDTEPGFGAGDRVTMPDGRTAEIINKKPNGLYQLEVTDGEGNVMDVAVPASELSTYGFGLNEVSDVAGEEEKLLDRMDTAASGSNTPADVTRTTSLERENAGVSDNKDSANNLNEQTQTPDFPRDKSGEIDYSKITDDAQYIAALHEDFKDSPEEVPAILQEYQQMAEKNVAKAKRISDPVKRRKAIAKAQAEVNRFASMYEQARPKAEIPEYERIDTLVNGNNRQREAQLGDFVSLRDYLLRGIGAGRFKFLWNDKGPKRGLRNEILSSKHTEDERRKRISFLDNNGFTPETLAHYIWDNRGADIPESWSDDVQVIRDEINDILLSYDTPTAMIDAAIELHDKYEQLEDYYGDTISPDEIANFDANDASQNELLLSLPSEQPREISEQELNEYYGQDNGIENIGTVDAAGSREGTDSGTGIRSESPDQTARDSGAPHAPREAGEQGARNSVEEPDAQRAGNDHEGNYSTPHQLVGETGNSDTGRDIRTTSEVEPSALHPREPGGLSDNRGGDAAARTVDVRETSTSVGGDERAIQTRETLPSISALDDKDFEAGYRDVILPELPDNVNELIGTHGKKVLIKKNIFDKNKKNHPELGDAAAQKQILSDALYYAEMVISAKPKAKPNYWIVVKIGDKYANVTIDADNSKNAVEVVNWYWLNDKTLEAKKKRAIKEGGQVLITLKRGQQSEISALHDSSFDNKDNRSSAEKQETPKDIASLAENQTAKSVQKDSKQDELNSNTQHTAREAAIKKMVADVKTLSQQWLNDEISYETYKEESIKKYKEFYDTFGDVNDAAANYRKAFIEYYDKHFAEILSSYVLDTLADSKEFVAQLAKQPEKWIDSFIEYKEIPNDPHDIIHSNIANYVSGESRLGIYLANTIMESEARRVVERMLFLPIIKMEKQARAKGEHFAFKDGVFETKHDNGRTAFRGTFKKGKLDGVCEVFDESGNTLFHETFKNGKPVESGEEADKTEERSTPKTDSTNKDGLPKDIVSLAEKQVKNNEIENAVEALAKRFNTHITIYRSKEEIPKIENDNHYHQKLQAKGWFDMKADAVFINIFNVESVEDARSTVFHELVAHKGILDMLGKEKHKALLESIFEMMPKEAQECYLSAYGSEYIAADEYIAYLAENEANLSPREQGIWNQIKQAIIDFIERHLDIELSRENVDDVINALLVASRERLEHKSDNRDEKRDPTKELKGSKRTPKIDDFGEKIGGARKDIWAEYVSKLKNVSNEELQSNPLSKTFKRPDFAALVTDGKLTQNQALFLSFMYENIPNKPRKRVFVGGWVNLVREVMDSLEDAIANGQNSRLNDEVIERFVAQARPFTKDAELKTYMDVQKAAGFPNQIVKMDGYSIKKFSGRDGYTVVQKHRTIKDTNTYEEAVQVIADILTDESIGSATKRKKVDIAVYQNRKTKEIFIGKVLRGKEPYVLKKGFESVNEAHAYLRENREALEAQWEKINKPVKERRDKNRTRSGKDWRDGRDITPEEYSDTFGFRGVEFGNWVNNKERQKALNDSYDAFMDLSELIGVSPRALSLNGELAIAFGARGKGSIGGAKAAAAHYERGKVVINLTKNKGAGSLAHEWFHALDNYFGRRRGKKEEYITNFPRKLGYNGVEDVTRQEVLDAFNHLVKTLKASDLYKRSKQLDSVRSNDYWSTMIEMAARAFEHYVIEKATDSGLRNDYLANLSTISEWIEESFDIDSYPYPTKEETPVMRDAFDNLFETIQEKVDAETGNAVLFRIGETGKFRGTTRKKFNQLVDLLNKTGLAKDVKTGQDFWDRLETLDGSERVRRQTVERENARFNIELDNFKEGRHKGLLHLGTPSARMRVAGVNANELTLSPKVLNAKLKQHRLNAEHLHNLVLALQKPMFIYAHGKNIPNIIAVTELDVAGGKIAVSVRLDKQGHVIEINNVSSIHNKDAAIEIDRLSDISEADLKGLIRWVDKEKVSRWFNTVSLYGNRHADNNTKLISFANIIENFENPSETVVRNHIENRRIAAANLENIANPNIYEDVLSRIDKKKYVNYLTHVLEVDESELDAAISDTDNIDAYLSDWYDLSIRSGVFELEGPLEEPAKRLIGDNYVRLFHHTSDAVKDAIRQSGLVAGLHDVNRHGMSGGVFVTSETSGEVVDWYKRGAEAKLGGDAITFEVALKLSELKPDEHDADIRSGAYQYETDNIGVDRIIGVKDSFFNDVQFLKQPNGTVYGFVDGTNTVYLNTDAMNLNTPIHEFGHLWVSHIQKNYPELYARAKEVFKDSAYMKAVQADANYSHLNEEQQLDEAMARALGDKGEREVRKTKLEKIKDWIAAVWTRIGVAFGVQHLTPEQIARLSLEDIVDIGASELLSGVSLKKEAGNAVLSHSLPTNEKGKLIHEVGALSTTLPSNNKSALFDDKDTSRGSILQTNYAKRLDEKGEPILDEARVNELNRIKEKAIAAGTFMKAPNGKPTNLTERQWLHVRTPEYKQKHGDWEKVSRIEKLKKSKPIEITGEEIPASDDLKVYKKNALEYGKHLRGEYVNKDTGNIILLSGGNSRGGLREVLQHDYKSKAHLQSIAAIPQIIEESIYIDSAKNEDLTNYRNVETFDYYVAGLKINGIDYTVKAVIAIQTNGERYYDHSLTKIEKGKLLGSIPEIQKSGETNNSPFSSVKDKRLISILQTNYDKRLDEKGEPILDEARVNELNRIKEKAIAAGTFMKAPNGKPTNLTERQWLHVRTPEFKKWFGDWELKHKRTSIVPVSDRFKNLSEAKQWAKENVAGKSFINKDTGNEILVSRNAIYKTFSSKAFNQSSNQQVHLNAISELKAILEESVLGETYQDKENSDSILEMQRYYGALSFDGKLYRVKTTIKKVLNEGNRYYTYEVQDVELLDKEIESEERRSIGYETTIRRLSNNSSNSITMANVLKGVERNKRKGEYLLDDDSKVVDEKGEPTDVELLDKEIELKEERPIGYGMTALPSTNSINSITMANLLKGVETNKRKGEYLLDNHSKVVDENGEPLVVYHGTNDLFDSFAMQEGALGRGAYFSSTFTEAADYAAEKLGEELSEDNDYGGDWAGSYIKEVFLNVRDDDNIAHSQYGDAMIYLASEPNQIKSATDNVGRYDSANDDIRFSVESDDERIRRINELSQHNDGVVALTNERLDELKDLYDGAASLDERYEVARVVARSLDKALGRNYTFVAKTNEELAGLLPGLSDDIYRSIRHGDFAGIYWNNSTHVCVENIDSASLLVRIWFHENGHRMAERLFTGTDFVRLYDKINPDFEKLDVLLPESYRNLPKQEQGEEIVTHAIEWIVENNTIEQILKGDIDYGFMPKQLREFVEPIFNALQNEQNEQNEQSEDHQHTTRQAGGTRLLSRRVEDNGNTIDGGEASYSNLSKRTEQNGTDERRTRGYRDGGAVGGGEWIASSAEISKEQALYEAQLDDLKEKHFRLEIELDKLRRKVKNHEMGLGEFAMERAKLTPQMEALTQQMEAIQKKMAEATSAAEEREAPPKQREGESIADYAKRVSAWWQDKSSEISELTQSLNKANAELKRLRHIRNTVVKKLNSIDDTQVGGNRTILERTRETAKLLQEYIRENLNSELADWMGIGELRSLMSGLNNPTSKKDVEAVLIAVDRTLNNIEERKNRRTLDALLKTKVLDWNKKGVSIAKTVDDDTRRSFEYIRANQHLTEAEIEARIKTIEENPNRGVLGDEEMAQLADLEIIRLLSYIQVEKNKLKEIDHDIRLTEEKATASIQKLKSAERVHTKALKKAYWQRKTAIKALRAERNEVHSFLNKTYDDAIRELNALVNTGRSKLREQEEARIRHRNEIIREAIDAVKDKPIPTQGEEKERTRWDKLKESLKNNGAVQFFLSPQGSFNFMLKYIDRNHPMGEGTLYKRFMKSDEGVYAAHDAFYKGEREFRREVQEKAEEIFGMPFKKVIADSRSDSGMRLEYFDSAAIAELAVNFGAEVERLSSKMSKGELMYIYMVWQQEDGRDKLEWMGISDSDIRQISDVLGEKYIRMAHWIQTVFLPKKREKYNATHKKMFGTSMAKVKNYFPIQYNRKDFGEKTDLANRNDGYFMPATMTGSIINRVRNMHQIDIAANAFDVLMKNGHDMEEWNAYAPVRRSLNALLRNTYVKNLIEANDKLGYKKFKESAIVATRAMQEKHDPSQALASLNRYFAGSAISFRLNTALKQFLSFPAYLEYSNSPKYLARLARNLSPDVWRRNFEWGVEHLPGFAERWEGGNIGMEKLVTEHWRKSGEEPNALKKALNKYTEIGMFPNRLVDAFTILAGAKSIYEHGKSRYLKSGMDVDAAERMALFDAGIAYNETQQSARDEFLAPVQKKKDVFNRGVTTFMNANFAYMRKFSEGVYELTRGSHRQIEHLTKQYVLAGMDADAAAEKAKSEVYGAKGKAFKNVILFGFFMQMTWTLAEKMLYGLWDDDDEKEKDIVNSIVNAPLSGMYFGSQINSVMQGYRLNNPLIMFSEGEKRLNDIQKAYRDNGLYSPAVAFAVTKTMLQSGGINYYTWLNMYTAVESAVQKGEWDASNTLFMLNAPASVRKSYASKLREGESIADYATRVAAAYDRDLKSSEAKALLRKKLFSDAGDMTRFNRVYAASKELNTLRKKKDLGSKPKARLSELEAMDKEYALTNFYRVIETITKRLNDVSKRGEMSPEIEKYIDEVKKVGLESLAAAEAAMKE